MYKLYELIHITISFIELFLALRALFFLIRSDSDHLLVKFTYSITDPILEVFKGLISQRQRYKMLWSGYYLDLLPIFALVVFWFIDWLIRIIFVGV
jgi:hypothetical protein